MILTAVAGTAITFMRSDGAPPLNQAIAPTMTGTWNYTPSADAVPVTINAPATLSADMQIWSPLTNVDTVVTNDGDIGVSEPVPTANVSIRARGIDYEAEIVAMAPYAWWDASDLDGNGTLNAAYTDGQDNIATHSDKSGNAHTLTSPNPSTYKWILNKTTGPNGTPWITPKPGQVGRWDPWATGTGAFGNPAGWTAFIVVATGPLATASVYFLRGTVAQNVTCNIPDGDFVVNPTVSAYVNPGVGGETNHTLRYVTGTNTAWSAVSAEWRAFSWRYNGTHQAWNQGGEMALSNNNAGTAPLTVSSWDRIFQTTPAGSVTAYSYSEIILFQTALTEGQRNIVQDYLNIKYGGYVATIAAQPLQDWKDYDGTIDSVVDETLNFGLGIDDPQAKLHVVGNTILAGHLTMSGSTSNIYLPSTTSATTGIIFKDGYRWIHDYTDPSDDDFPNLFIGRNSGNFTLNGDGTPTFEGTANIGIGELTLSVLTKGYSNFAAGYSALGACTEGNFNFALGESALGACTVGHDNAAVGANALDSVTSGDFNVGIGAGAGGAVTGNQCIFIGSTADASVAAIDNAIAIGYGTLVGVSNTTVIGNLSTTLTEVRGNLVIRDQGTGFKATINTSQIPADDFYYLTETVTGNEFIVCGRSTSTVQGAVALWDLSTSGVNLFDTNRFTFDNTNGMLFIGSGTFVDPSIRFTAVGGDTATLSFDPAGLVTFNSPSSAGRFLLKGNVTPSTVPVLTVEGTYQSTTGMFRSTEVDGGGESAFEFVATAARTTDPLWKISNSAGGFDYMVGSAIGEWSFGVAAAAQAGNVLAFNVSDLFGTVPSTNWVRGIQATILHVSGSTAGSNVVGVIGAVQYVRGADIATSDVAGLVGMPYCDIIGTNYGSNQMAAVVGVFNTNPNASPFTSTVVGTNARVGGNWSRVSNFYATYASMSSATLATFGTSIPVISTAAFFPIQAAASSETWAIETSAPSNGTAVFTPGLAGCIKISFPVRGTRRTHAYFVPTAFTAALKTAGTVAGDVVFDDGTNFLSGLHQRDNDGWVKLLNDDLVFYDNEIVAYDDESVGYH